MNFNNGYIEIYMPEHPYARSNGTILEHRLIAEKKLGRYLKTGEVVHHLDENKTNNNPDNLIVFRTLADHSRFHKIGIMKEMDDGTYICPIPEHNIVKCKCCGEYFISNNNTNTNDVFCSMKCVQQYREIIIKEKISNGTMPSKEQLDILIHTISFVKIAEMYNVSDNTVRKWCKKYNLPYKHKDLHVKKKRKKDYFMITLIM